MSRYIDADELIVIGLDNPDCEHQFKFVPWEFIEDAPTADVVEVVRCKDCRHYSADGWGYGNCYRRSVEYLRMADNGFCSRGERREDAEKTD